MSYDVSTVTLTPGTFLGPYQIVRAIGAGGMGEVYEALDTRLGRSVAIKVIAPDVAHDSGRVARFDREARLSSSLNHANIVTIHDFAQSDGMAYIAMEIVDGKSLRELLSAGRVQARKIFSIAAQIAEGLAAAHAAGIIHRDLKPENVMITNAGVVKILDFGLARGQTSADVTSVLLTGPRHVMGTAAYMSPEQATGAALDFRSDQFALGTILFEMASGHHPFRRSSTLAMLEAIQTEEPPSLAELETPWPESFVWIVQRCLAKDPAERYASTRDLALDLGRLRDASTGRPVAGMKKRRSALNATRIAALVLALIAAGLASALFFRRAVGDGDAAPMHLTLHMPDVMTVTNEIVTPLALSPDGRRVIVTGYGAGRWQIFVRDLNATAAVPIPGTENGYAPELSPDGRHVAFFADRKLKIVPLEGGPPRIVCDSGESSMSWGPDGTILLARNGKWGTGIFAVKASGGPLVPLTHRGQTREKVFHRWPELMPDGKSFLYLAAASEQARDGGARRHVLMAGTLDGGAPKEVGPIDSRVVFHDGKLLYVRDGSLLAHGFDVRTMSFTGEPVPIVDGVYNFNASGVAAFAVSRSGTVVYRRPRSPSGLVWFDREGRQGSELAHLVLPRQPGSISPDGQRFATGVVDPKVGSSDLWIYELSRESSTRLTYGATDDTRPVWSADGRSLFFRSDSSDGGGPPDVYRHDLGSDQKHLVFHGPYVEEPSALSPDGKHMIIQRWSEVSGSDLLAVSLENGKATDFVNTPFDEEHARFSPDGRWVAYDSLVSGKIEVYLQRFPERGPPIRVSTAGGSTPRWSGDGRELFYLMGAEVMSVAVRSNESVIEAGVPRALFRRGGAIVDFEVLPDGKRFLVRTPEDRVPEVHLVINALPAAR